MDERGGLGDVVDVVTLEDEAILDGVVPLDGHALLHDAGADALLAEKVANLNLLALVADVEVHGEVSVHRTHLVPETLGDSVEAVGHVRDDGAEGGEALVGAEEHGADDGVGLLVVDHVDAGNVREVPGQDAAGALHGELPRLEGHIHTLGDGKDALRLQNLHSR